MMFLRIYIRLGLILLPTLVKSEPRFLATNLDLNDAPYLLDSGEPYRDVITVEASRRAANFALQFQPHKKQLVNQNRLRENFRQKNPPPQFSEFRSFQPASLQSDNEIFDFTDSRFINAPADNRQNFPLVNENSSPLIIDEAKTETYPITSYSYNPTPNVDSFVHFGSSSSSSFNNPSFYIQDISAEHIQPFSVFSSDKDSTDYQPAASEQVLSFLPQPEIQGDVNVEINHGQARSFSRTSFG